MIFFRCPPRGNISREEPWAGSAPGGEGAGETRRGMNPDDTVLGIQILSPQHSAQSFILITFWHHIITRHITSHHRKHRRENGPPGQDTEKENDIHWTEDNISLNFWNDIHRASGIIDKRDKTLSLNKLFWAKKSLGNIAAGSSSYSFNSFCLFS